MQDGNFILFGASGGIGQKVTRLLSEGSRAALVGRNLASLEKLRRSGRDLAITADVTQSKNVDQAFTQAIELFGSVEGVALMVGSILLKPAHVTSDEEWEQTLATNLTSAFQVVRAAGRFLKSGGSVVLVSTVAARLGLPNHEAISAAKAGVEGLARSAAATYAHRNLRFNVVAPGLVRTPLSHRITSNEAALKASIAMHPLGRIGEAEEVARLIAWLLDPANSWVTGQVFAIDGGLSSLRPRV